MVSKEWTYFILKGFLVFSSEVIVGVIVGSDVYLELIGSILLYWCRGF